MNETFFIYFLECKRLHRLYIIIEDNVYCTETLFRDKVLFVCEHGVQQIKYCFEEFMLCILHVIFLIHPCLEGLELLFWIENLMDHSSCARSEDRFKPVYILIHLLTVLFWIQVRDVIDRIAYKGYQSFRATHDFEFPVD